MPRLMSVAHTEAAVVTRTKTVTRRAGLTFLKPNDRLTLCRKVMGRRGEPLVRLAEVEVIDTRRELLGDITAEDVALEGFPRWTVEEFLEFFTTAMGTTPEDPVTRIQWAYLDPTADLVAAAIVAHRMQYSDELGLHDALEQAFTVVGLRPRREVSLNPSGRIDFLIGTTGVEVKVAGSAEAVTRQLRRYAPHVDDLVLVTTKAAHRHVPDIIDGKPCRVIHVQGSAW